METLYFVLGMLSVVTLLAVVGMVMTANKMRKLTQEQDILKHLMGNENDGLHRRVDEAEALIDKKEHDLINYADKLYQNHEDNLNELYKYVDSRTDKMADGISKHIADINQQLAGK